MWLLSNGYAVQRGVVVAAGYGYCLAFPFEACGGVHDCVGFGFFKKSEENTRFPPTSLFLLKTDTKKSPTFIGKSRLKVYS